MALCNLPPDLPEGIYRRSLRFVLFSPHATTGNAARRYASRQLGSRALHDRTIGVGRNAWHPRTRFNSFSSSGTSRCTKVSFDAIANGLFDEGGGNERGKGKDCCFAKRYDTVRADPTY